MCLVIAGSLDQSRTVFSYALAFLEASPVLAQEIVGTTRNEIRLRNGITIAVHANSFRTIRGRTICAAILDECAFWRDESSAAPDVETYTAILPALLTTRGMLVGISTPYRRTGLLHQKFKACFGVDDANTLVVQGSTRCFHPALTDDDIAAQRAADPSASASEWDAAFRHDRSSYLDERVIDLAVEHGRPLELPPVRGTSRFHAAWTDASGGTGVDAYTVAIGHKERDTFVIDVVRGTNGPFNPMEATKSYGQLLKEYGCRTVYGDYYAAEWVSSAWRSVGVTYIRSDIPKSQIYLNVIPLFMRGLVRLPDDPRLLRELRLLERQAHRGGRESVDHPRGGRDDYSNSACGVLHLLSLRHGYRLDVFRDDFCDEDKRPNGEQPAAADRRLHELYASIDGAIKFGLLR